MTRTALIAAGGTGGHMFPAEALAHELRGRGWRVILSTDPRGGRYTERFPADEVWTGDPVSMGGGLMGVLALPVTALRLLASRAAMAKRLRAAGVDLVAGFGGYPSFPAVAAAKSLGLPFILHEQNAVLGRVNRRYAMAARLIASGFQRLDRLPPGARHEVAGNPVRPDIAALAGEPYQAPEPGGEVRILVIGGSQGARILSLNVPMAIARLPESLRRRLRVAQQTRQENLTFARDTYAEAKVEAELDTFFNNMAERYRWAHLVIARAGASSCSEIAVAGRPAILAPFAAAMDDHQTANAESLGRGAVVVAEHDATPEGLAAALIALFDGSSDLEEMAAASRARAKPHAAKTLADLIEAEFADEPKKETSA